MNKDELNTYCMPVNIVGTGDTKKNKQLQW